MLTLTAIVAILVGSALIVIAFTREPDGGSSRGPASSPSRHDAALRVLDARHARGELTRERYEQMRADLERSAEER